MSRKKLLLLLAFSVCLNAGFLIATLVGLAPAGKPGAPPPHRAYSRHLELLNGLDIPDGVRQQATTLLDTFMAQRTALIVQKLDHKLESLALLEKNPALSRGELEARHIGEEQIEEAISALDFDYTLKMRQILPPDQLAVMYANAADMLRPHRDRVAHRQPAAH